MMLLLKPEYREWAPCPVRSDRQTTSLPVADNWIDEDESGGKTPDLRREISSADHYTLPPPPPPNKTRRGSHVCLESLALSIDLVWRPGFENPSWHRLIPRYALTHLPANTTAAQHHPNIGSMSRVCWVEYAYFQNKEILCSGDTSECLPRDLGQLIVKCDITQKTRGINPMLFQCYASVEDAALKLKHHWVNTSCLLGKTLCVR